jgi:hypothetical protein
MEDEGEQKTTATEIITAVAKNKQRKGVFSFCRYL